MATILTVSPDDFQDTIDDHISRGFRLSMITPADSPREALLQKPVTAGLTLRIVAKDNRSEGTLERADPLALPEGQASQEEWKVGRAGMMYRDLFPDRLGGKLIASHIRILDGGPVADTVHYHKVDFQIIYCLKGAIKVVYEDQGPPFLLRPGDCVLQPPEIRHRVLEAEAGSEVIEIASPAVHETWFDHVLQLPTSHKVADRIFSTQRFVLHRDVEELWRSMLPKEVLSAETTIGHAGTHVPTVFTLRASETREEVVSALNDEGIDVTILIAGRGVRVHAAR